MRFSVTFSSVSVRLTFGTFEMNIVRYKASIVCLQENILTTASFMIREFYNSHIVPLQIRAVLFCVANVCSTAVWLQATSFL